MQMKQFYASPSQPVVKQSTRSTGAKLSQYYETDSDASDGSDEYSSNENADATDIIKRLAENEQLYDVRRTNDLLDTTSSEDDIDALLEADTDEDSDEDSYEDVEVPRSPPPLKWTSNDTVPHAVRGNAVSRLPAPSRLNSDLLPVDLGWLRFGREAWPCLIAQVVQ
ncbi:uncharacterized protein [Typha angustifolia]|uniref:uncharacterized protein n=1 Tax=Typha angustifolia TaxID=59011 RepID=UPI003C2B9A89